MPKKDEEKDEFDQKLFNAAVDLGHWMIDKGYAKAWFSWIGWIGIEALLLAAARRTHSNFLYVVAAVSAFILFFVGIAGVEKLRDDLVPAIKGGKFLFLCIWVLISLSGMWVVMNILTQLLASNVT